MGCQVIAPRADNHRRLIDATSRHSSAAAAAAAYSSSSYLRSDNNCSRNMYMIVDLMGRPGFVLYRINDPLHLLPSNNNNSSSTHPNVLCPLLFFQSIERGCFNCIKFGSKFYFLGLDQCFRVHEPNSVYTIEETDLMCIEPSEDNDVNNFKHLFTTTKNPMNSPKYFPTLFVANQKLYVLSPYCSKKTNFEVFSPSDETWQVLPPPPFHKSLSYDAPLLVLERQQIICFCDALFAFNLKTNTWTATADDSYYPNYDAYDYDYDYDYDVHPPTFRDKRVSIIGDMAFGFLYNEHEGYYVCASRTTTSPSPGKELMQPNLAPDQDFLDVWRSSRFTYLRDQSLELYSNYIVALQDLDGKQVLCIVTYGTKPGVETGCYVYNAKTSYVALSFFDIPGDFYTLKDTPIQEYNAHSSDAYAHEKAEDGGVIRRYFNAKFRHAAHFVISNSHLVTHGRLEACFF